MSTNSSVLENTETLKEQALKEVKLAVRCVECMEVAGEV